MHVHFTQPDKVMVSIRVPNELDFATGLDLPVPMVDITIRNVRLRAFEAGFNEDGTGAGGILSGEFDPTTGSVEIEPSETD